MKRSKTVTVGELLDEFFQRPYVAAKVAEGRLRDTWREIVGPPWAPKSTAARKSDWSMRSSSGEIHLFSSWRLYNSRQILALFKEKMYFCTLEAKIQTKTAYFYDKAKRAGSTRHSDE